MVAGCAGSILPDFLEDASAGRVGAPYPRFGWTYGLTFWYEAP